jgi:hypothetical protein
MKVLITEQQLRSILTEQKKEDPKPKIVGKDNMYNRLVKSFGSKVVGKYDGSDNLFVFNLPNKDTIQVLYDESKWKFTYNTKENIYSKITDNFYFFSEGTIELIGDLDFKVTLLQNEGTYDSQTKKWNGSLDVRPLPKRTDPNSVIQSNDTFKRLFKYYDKKLKVGAYPDENGIIYYVLIDFGNNQLLRFFDEGMSKYYEGDDEYNVTFTPIDNDGFKIKMQDGQMFDTKTKKWIQGKPFKNIEITGKDITEFATNIIKQTKNTKIDLDSMKIDVDNFKITFNGDEDGTPVYELYLSLNSSKNPYDNADSIINNFPKSKIIGKGNFPNKPELNYTLIAIII